MAPGICHVRLRVRATRFCAVLWGMSGCAWVSVAARPHSKRATCRQSCWRVHPF